MGCMGDRNILAVSYTESPMNINKRNVSRPVKEKKTRDASFSFSFLFEGGEREFYVLLRDC